MRLQDILLIPPLLRKSIDSFIIRHYMNIILIIVLLHHISRYSMTYTIFQEDVDLQGVWTLENDTMNWIREYYILLPLYMFNPIDRYDSRIILIPLSSITITSKVSLDTEVTPTFPIEQWYAPFNSILPYMIAIMKDSSPFHLSMIIHLYLHIYTVPDVFSSLLWNKIHWWIAILKVLGLEHRDNYEILKQRSNSVVLIDCILNRELERMLFVSCY